MKPKAFFVVSAWHNDISWVEDYTDKYIIYDKSHTLPTSEKIRKVKNVGYNINDILDFIIKNYENLPDLIAFLEGNPFDHCSRDKFDQIIYDESFTPIESYEHIADSDVNRKGKDGGYMEINNSWYIGAHMNTHGPAVNRYLQSYNQFLKRVFINPDCPQWVRFSPGGQYIVPKENILFYSKGFYRRLISYVNYHRIPSEGHIIERALYTIFTNEYREKNLIYGYVEDIINLFVSMAKKLYRVYFIGTIKKVIKLSRKSKHR